MHSKPQRPFLGLKGADMEGIGGSVALHVTKSELILQTSQLRNALLQPLDLVLHPLQPPPLSAPPRSASPAPETQNAGGRCRPSDTICSEVARNPREDADRWIQSYPTYYNRGCFVFRMTVGGVSCFVCQRGVFRVSRRTLWDSRMSDSVWSDTDIITASRDSAPVCAVRAN
eukprot:973154-Prorocentrum_minimum.AAC.1